MYQHQELGALVPSNCKIFLGHQVVPLLTSHPCWPRANYTDSRLFRVHRSVVRLASESTDKARSRVQNRSRTRTAHPSSMAALQGMRKFSGISMQRKSVAGLQPARQCRAVRVVRVRCQSERAGSSELGASRRQVLAALSAAAVALPQLPAAAFVQPPQGFRLYLDRLDGYQVSPFRPGLCACMHVHWGLCTLHPRLTPAWAQHTHAWAAGAPFGRGGPPPHAAQFTARLQPSQPLHPSPVLLPRGLESGDHQWQ